MTAFADKVSAWQRTHGRHDLPWQRTRDPYRIWISEVMLQQTQVATVIPYYVRFMVRFPDVSTLAAADLDDVLAHWSGLGYYSRARNLHRAALRMCELHGGQFPRRIEEVAALPGIGRSTAAAIVVFAYGERHAILDGNVKRVLARACGIEGHPGDRAAADALWHAAERLLPAEGIESYTQGLMDLGATVCVRRQPHCLLCPVSESCVALRDGRIEELPAPRPHKVLPHRSTVMLVLAHNGDLLLEKRPASGVWGGLWCFPELGQGEDARSMALQRFGARMDTSEWLPDIEHGFTHYTLTISPQRVQVASVQPRAAEADYRWMSIDEVLQAGIPAPVKRIVRAL